MTQFGLLIRTLLLSSVVYFALDVVRRSGDVSAPVRESLDELLSLGGMAGSSFDARGKTVLVTGASSGIGEALAYKYAALGAHVGLVARRAATLEQVKTKCEALGGGGRITTLSADVGTEDGWELVRTHVEQTMGGVLDLLVLNVGISMGSLFPDLVQANDAMRLTKKLMKVNFLGSIGPLDATLRALLKSKTGVRIAVISSLAGKMGLPSRSVYSASKFALQGFFDALRRELLLIGQSNSAVTMIYPGVVKTDINRLREGVAGKIAQLDVVNTGYEVDVAAAIMTRGIAEGRRDLIMSSDGSIFGLLKVSAGPLLDLFAPSLLDRMVINEAKKSMNLDDSRA